MKRGFLKTSKGKKALSHAPTVVSTSEGSNVSCSPSGGAPFLLGSSTQSDRKISLKEIPEIYHEPLPLVVTNVPGSQYPFPPDGCTVWLVYEPTLKKIFGPSPSVTPIPTPKRPERAFEVRPSSDKGLGIFATRDIEAEELIFSERPLLVAPSTNAGITVAVTSQVKDVDAETQIKIAKAEWEKRLHQALDSMHPEDRDEYLKLVNARTNDSCGPVHGIALTNGFEVESSIYDGDHVLPNKLNTYTAITKIGSRINHSCTPNVQQQFLIDSFSFTFEAARDIKAGEELCLSYIDVATPVAERRANLSANYGFVCHCTACDNATPESDILRQSFESLAEQHIGKLNWMGQGSMGEREIEPALKLRDALVKEGLTFTGAYKAIILMILVFYETVGMPEKAEPFRKELKRYPNFMDMLAKSSE